MPWFLEDRARRTDPACYKADAPQSKSDAPHIQPKPSISTNSLCSQQGKADHGHECTKHIAPRRRRCALGRPRALKASEDHNKRNEHNRVHRDPEEPRPPPLRASWLKSQTEAACEIGPEDNKHGGCQVPNEDCHDVPLTATVAVHTIRPASQRRAGACTASNDPPCIIASAINVTFGGVVLLMGSPGTLIIATG